MLINMSHQVMSLHLGISSTIHFGHAKIYYLLVFTERKLNRNCLHSTIHLLLMKSVEMDTFYGRHKPYLQEPDPPI